MEQEKIRRVREIIVNCVTGVHHLVYNDHSVTTILRTVQVNIAKYPSVRREKTLVVQILA